MPVKGVYVMIRNYTREIFFYYLTEEDGTYEVNVGTSGNFFIEVDGPAHHFTVKEVEISLFEEKDVDFQVERYEHNVMIFFYNQDEIYPLKNFEVQITDEYSMTNTYHTMNNGWLNLTLETGNYSIISKNDLLQTYEEDFNVSDEKIFRRYEHLYVANVDESASRSISDVFTTISPRSFRAVKLTSSEPTSMYLKAQSNEEITIIEMTHMMYDKYLSDHTGALYPHDEPPVIDYDTKVGPAYRGGGTVDMWRIPYYIVFENNNSVTAEVEFELFYEYSDPIIVSLEEGPLSPVVYEEDDDSDPSSALSYTPLSTILLSIFLFTISMIMLKRKK
jgi:hypothetical protein